MICLTRRLRSPKNDVAHSLASKLVRTGGALIQAHGNFPGTPRRALSLLGCKIGSQYPGRFLLQIKLDPARVAQAGLDAIGVRRGFAQPLELKTLALGKAVQTSRRFSKMLGHEKYAPQSTNWCEQDWG